MKTVVSATVNAAAATGKAVSNTHIATTSSATSIALKSESSRETGGVAAMQAPNAANSAKRPISLDLNTAAPAKKQRLAGPSPLLLETPDFANKTLNTPDIEKILLSSNFLQTPDIFPPNVSAVTSEQEAFGKGFDEALHSLHTSKNSQTQMGAAGGNPTTTSNNVATVTAAAPPVVAPAAVTSVAPTAGTGMSGGSFTYTNLETFPVAIKDEPQNAPASPPVSPIDMETQEKIKLERKRQRNRVAASKCRKRKLERISKLEDKVKMLKGENSDLAGVVKNLKDHVAQLKQQVINHMESGCDIQSIYNGAALLHVK